MPEVAVIDTTLREGLQSSREQVFKSDSAIKRYLSRVSALGIVNRFEAYMPGPLLSQEIWAHLLSNYSDRLQVYVGPAHFFTIEENLELLEKPFGILSTTLIDTTRKGLDYLSVISESTYNSPLRVGIECASELSTKEALDLVYKIGKRSSVQVVSVNDSNGRMTPEWGERLITGYDPTINPDTKIGFHLHNGSGGRASEKAEAITSNVAHPIEVDATLSGIGDRDGILSLSDIGLIKQLQTASLQELDPIATETLATQTRLSTEDLALSHYLPNGQLRPEYR